MSVITKKALGQSGIEVSAMGLGCWGLTGAYGQTDPKNAIQLIRRAIDLGLNFLDTADVYAQGENERLLARAMKGRRNKIILATKFGYVGDEQGELYINGQPSYVRNYIAI